jgi:hypothetical protein
MYIFTKTESGQTKALFEIMDDHGYKLVVTTNYPTLEMTKHGHLYGDIKPFFMSLDNSEEGVISEWALKDVRELNEFLGKLILQYELSETKSSKETPILEQIEIIRGKVNDN